MFTDADDSIRQLLIRQVPLDVGEVDVCFDMPSRDWSGGLAKPTLNLYLYDIRENRDLRENDWIVSRDCNNTANKRRPPVRIDLSYLVTAWTTAVEDEHRLLWGVLSAFLRHPVLPREVIQGELKEAVERLDIDIRTVAAQPDGVFKDPGDFWTAIDNQLKPSIALVVTVPMDLQAEFTAPLAVGRALRVGPIDGAGAGDELLLIAGTVRARGRDGQSVPGATVSVLGRGLATETDETGRYTFRHLSPGRHTFRVAAPGQKAKDLPVTVPAGAYDLEI